MTREQAKKKFDSLYEGGFCKEDLMQVLDEIFDEYEMNIIEIFEARLNFFLGRPFIIEYLSLYKHKRIKVKEDTFYGDGSTIAWAIGSTYKEAIDKIVILSK
jgi:hypothetical protein